MNLFMNLSIVIMDSSVHENGMEVLMIIREYLNKYTMANKKKKKYVEMIFIM